METSELLGKINEAKEYISSVVTNKIGIQDKLVELESYIENTIHPHCEYSIYLELHAFIVEVIDMVEDL